MKEINLGDILATKALDNFPENCLRSMVKVGEERSYGPAQSLCQKRLIPNEIHLILSGSARVIIEDQGRPTTLCKLAPGQWIGLASLLRVKGCEEIATISEVKTISWKANIILERLANDKSFAQWCGTTIWEAEIADILGIMISKLPKSYNGLKEAVLEAKKRAKCTTLGEGEIMNLSVNELAVMASNNTESWRISDIISEEDKVGKINGPLPARILILDKVLLKDEGGLLGDTTHSSLQTDNSIDEASERAIHLLSGDDKKHYPESLSVRLGSRDEPSFQIVRATTQLEGALACFQMLSFELKFPYRKDAIERIIRESLRREQDISLQLIGNIASVMGLHVTGVRIQPKFATQVQTPALIIYKKHLAVLQWSHAEGLVLASPQEGWVTLSKEAISKLYEDGIECLLIEKNIQTPEKRFGFSWFWPALKKYRATLIQVLVASFVVQLFGLANPLLIQVIVDKVINLRSLDTLQILGVALIVVTILEGLLGSLRTFLFAETTNRLDVRLGAEVIDHLLRLPLDYFDRRPVGELGTRIAELEKIRSFLTGQALTTVLDAGFSVIYVVVMVMYSWVLAIVALSVLPVQIAITVLGAPLFRRQYRDAASENAKTQSHLVEVLSGIQTVKAQNVEMISRWKWQEYYSKYIARSFEKTITGTVLSESSQILQKLSQLLVLWVGATLVLSGDLSLGQLIAFRIISGYVTEPMLRLSSIWQNVQELKVSFERLADVVDTLEESGEQDKQKIPLPLIDGRVQFIDVDFSFKTNEASKALTHINLDIEAGTFVGIVGQSGSGKSTLTKLITRLYKPQNGKILIDGYNIDKVELYSLRRQIGIVPQEPLLFSGSVAENIALIKPNASTDEIVDAARLACAHDFIMGLQSGYSTNIGEKGSALSGGQRQRIALARTLLIRPKMLVLDEATSALDYDTERRICNNLLEELSDRTVFFITHRLSTIRRADMIVMMSEGSIAEIGTHPELLDLKGRYYALYRQQESQ